MFRFTIKFEGGQMEFTVDSVEAPEIWREYLIQGGIDLDAFHDFQLDAAYQSVITEDGWVDAKDQKALFPV